MKFEVESLEQLPKVAQKLVSLFKHKIILFDGEMGAGKTTLIKEIAKAMNSKDKVTSPTFSLVNEYDSDYGKIYHFDFYRLNDEQEALDFGLEEYIYSNYFCLMEWADKIINFVPDDHHVIKISTYNSLRIITFE